jgi:hypothetical protein
MAANSSGVPPGRCVVVQQNLSTLTGLNTFTLLASAKISVLDKKIINMDIFCIRFG